MTEISPLGGESALKAEVLALLREAVDHGVLADEAVVVVGGARHSMREDARGPHEGGSTLPGGGGARAHPPPPPPGVRGPAPSSAPRLTQPPWQSSGTKKETLRPSGLPHPIIVSPHSPDPLAYSSHEDSPSLGGDDRSSSLTPKEAANTDRFFRWLAKRDSKLELARYQVALSREADPECTFRPQTQASKRTYRGGDISRPMTDRLKEWESQREQRLREAREAKAAEQLAECTFEPSLSTRSHPKGTVKKVTPVAASPSVSLRQEADADAFIARLAAARAKSAKLKEAESASGKHYTGKTTVPEAPVLATAQRHRSYEGLRSHSPRRSSQANPPSKGTPPSRSGSGSGSGTVNTSSSYNNAAATAQELLSESTSYLPPQPPPFASPTFTGLHTIHLPSTGSPTLLRFGDGQSVLIHPPPPPVTSPTTHVDAYGREHAGRIVHAHQPTVVHVVSPPFSPPSGAHMSRAGGATVSTTLEADRMTISPTGVISSSLALGSPLLGSSSTRSRGVFGTVSPDATLTHTSEQRVAAAALGVVRPPNPPMLFPPHALANPSTAPLNSASTALYTSTSDFSGQLRGEIQHLLSAVHAVLNEEAPSSGATARAEPISKAAYPIPAQFSPHTDPTHRYEVGSRTAMPASAPSGYAHFPSGGVQQGTAFPDRRHHLQASLGPIGAAALLPSDSSRGGSSSSERYPPHNPLQDYNSLSRQVAGLEAQLAADRQQEAVLRHSLMQFDSAMSQPGGARSLPLRDLYTMRLDAAFPHMSSSSTGLTTGSTAVTDSVTLTRSGRTTPVKPTSLADASTYY